MPEWEWFWFFWDDVLLGERLLESAILAAQIESATGRRYISLDLWERLGKGTN